MLVGKRCLREVIRDGGGLHFQIRSRLEYIGFYKVRNCGVLSYGTKERLPLKEDITEVSRLYAELKCDDKRFLNCLQAAYKQVWGK